MHKGDISNQWSPAVVIDVDNLIISEEKKLLGAITHLDLLNDVKKILDYLFWKVDLSVYLVVHRARELDFRKVVQMLDQNYLTYTRHYWIKTPGDLNEVVNEPQVMRYFYHNSFPDRVTMISSGKAVMINNLMEVSQYL